MGKVLTLRKSESLEVLETLNKLRGLPGVIGVMFVIAYAEGHRPGIAGSYRDDPTQAVTIATEAMKKLYTYEARKRIDPFTASNFI